MGKKKKKKKNKLCVTGSYLHRHAGFAHDSMQKKVISEQFLELKSQPFVKGAVYSCSNSKNKKKTRRNQRRASQVHRGEKKGPHA